MQPVDPTPDTPRLGLEGKVNILLLLAIMGIVLLSGTWKSGVHFDVAGIEVGLEQIVRDVALVLIALVSIVLTPAVVRAQNQFSWGPMAEVAKLFAGIFLTMIPVLAMLKAGVDGAFAAVVRARHQRRWAADPCHVLLGFRPLVSPSSTMRRPTWCSSTLAGGDPKLLMTTLAPVLAAISAGSVFMGANTYIGNAPNLMVKAIAEDRGVRMPSFFGYMAWSGGYPGAAVRRDDLHLVPLKGGCNASSSAGRPRDLSRCDRPPTSSTSTSRTTRRTTIWPRAELISPTAGQVRRLHHRRASASTPSCWRPARS